MTAFAVAPVADEAARFLMVEIGAVHESKTNPRRHFDQTALKDLTDSIREKGVLVPLLVRPKGTHGAFEIVAGARRYRAARAAGLTSVPVLVRELDDKEALEVQVVENLQRADVHPLEEAEGYEQLLRQHGYAIETLVAKIGKSLSYLYQRLKLAALIEPAKKAFLEERITAGHAILIARLQPRDQKRALEYALPNQWSGSQSSVRALGKWIAEDINLDLAKAPFPTGDATLVPKAGACAVCPKRTGCQPALFADISKGDVCTDPACYRSKADAQLERRQAELRAAKTPFVRLATDYLHRGDKGPIHPYHWKRAAAKSCKDVTMGLVVEGDERGSSFLVCTNERCRKHFSGGATGSSHRHSTKLSASERAAQTRQRREQETAKARAAVLPVVLARRVPGFLALIAKRAAHFRSVPSDVLLGLARGMADDMAHVNPPRGRTRARYDEAIERIVSPRLPGTWQKDWRGRTPANALAARNYLGLLVFLAFDVTSIDKKLGAELDAQVKAEAAKTPAKKKAKK